MRLLERDRRASVGGTSCRSNWIKEEDLFCVTAVSGAWINVLKSVEEVKKHVILAGFSKDDDGQTATVLYSHRKMMPTLSTSTEHIQHAHQLFSIP